MADDLFDRQYELTISSPNEQPNEFNGVPKWIDASSDATTGFRYYSGSSTIPATAVKITDLQLQAKISKSTKASHNKAANEVVVFNMSKASRSIVEEKGALLVLKAGYRSISGGDPENLDIICMGQVTEVETIKKGMDVLTRILVKDAAVPQENSEISMSFKPKTSVKTIVDRLALQFNGVAKGYLATDDLADVIEEGGYSLSGSLGINFMKYLQSYGYRYLIENDSIYVYPDRWLIPTIGYGETTPEGEVTQSIAKRISKHVKSLEKLAPVIKPDNAKSIRKNRTAAGKRQADTSNNTGVTVETFLDGRIELGKMMFQIKEVKEPDDEMNGTYSIDSITHTLDYEGAKWDTTLKGTRTSNE